MPEFRMSEGMTIDDLNALAVNLPEYNQAMQSQEYLLYSQWSEWAEAARPKLLEIITKQIQIIMSNNIDSDYRVAGINGVCDAIIEFLDAEDYEDEDGKNFTIAIKNYFNSSFYSNLNNKIANEYNRFAENK